MLALIPNQKLSTSWWNPKHGKPYSESIHCVGDSEVSHGSELWHSLTTLGFSHVATAQPVEALIFHGCCDSLRSWPSFLYHCTLKMLREDKVTPLKFPWQIPTSVILGFDGQTWSNMVKRSKLQEAPEAVMTSCCFSILSQGCEQPQTRKQSPSKDPA